VAGLGSVAGGFFGAGRGQEAASAVSAACGFDNEDEGAVYVFGDGVDCVDRE
jgi:hypothetical protein